MFLAMNRFKIKVGNEDLFETIWRERDSHLEEVPGFIEFSLMRGDSNEEFTLFASHTIWSTKEDFSNWVSSLFKSKILFPLTSNLDKFTFFNLLFIFVCFC